MKGNLYIISAPSGAGKSSISKRIAATGEISLSVSYTTRPRRQEEEDGVAYFFITEEEFLQKRDAGEMLEYANVHGHWYGTPLPWIRKQNSNGKNVLLEIDWQGARLVREKMPDAISVFVLPPSMEDLRKRLQRRGQDSAKVIARRLDAAPREMAHASEYDYVIINRDLKESVDGFLQILCANRLRYACMSDEVAQILEPTKEQDGN